MKAIIDAGDIGEPMYAVHTLFRFPYRPGAEGWRHDQSRVGSWILEEPVHAFDSLMWYLERHGDPVSVLAARQRPAPRRNGMEDNFTALLRFRGGAYAVVTETLAAFEYHHVTEVVGREGAIRAWWSGTLDRTRRPAFELKVKRRGGEPETVALAASGELFELEAQLAQAVVAFRERRPLVSGEEARKRVIVCVEAERSLREGREIPLAF